VFKFRKTLIIVLSFLSILTVGSFALAQADLGLNSAANIGLQDGGGDIKELLVRIVRYALTFVGIIATVIVLYGGFLWMTARGKADQIRRAKQTLIAGIVGIIIILSAFAIVTFIVNLTETSLAPACTATCLPGEKCCNGGPDFCCALTDTCCGATNECCNGATPYCCGASGCSDDPTCGFSGSGLSFSIVNTIPDDGDSGVIRNLRLIFDFTMNINPATVDAATFQVTDAGTPIPGSVTVSGSRVVFQPDPGTCPVNSCSADQCFADGITVTVQAHGIESSAGDGLEYLYPLIGPPINCGSGALPACQITFDVGSVIDCDDPFVGLDFAQICAGPGNAATVSASDGSGVADVELIINDGVADIYNDSASAGGALTFFNIFNFDGSTFPASVLVTATANDIDSHSSSRSVNTTVRPGHCCNGLLDELQGELGTDCGGPCAACDGASCGISMNDDCIDQSLDCHANDDICLSRFCSCTNGVAECTAAGYAVGVDDCCICQQQPIIDWITPMGGFCRDGATLTNTACLNDQYCVDNEGATYTCDRDTSNAARLNLVTIYGRNFGDDPGSGGVTIDGQNAPLASAIGIAECDQDYWTDTAITVQVPNTVNNVGFPAVTVQVTADNGFFDTNDDLPGEEPAFDFIINTITRPGICGIDPFNGPAETTVVNYYGIQLGTANAYFGNLSNPIQAINSALNDGQANVPLLNPGMVSTFAISGQTYSNYQNFTVETVAPPGPVIYNFDPEDGAPGTYVTIYGDGFGNSQGASTVEFGGVEADYNFPAICAGGIWTDNQVIVKVPTGVSGLQTIFMTINGYPVIDSSGLTPSQFDINLVERPNLCRLMPMAQDLGEAVTLSGENFGPDANRIVRFHPATDYIINPADIFDTSEYNEVSAIIPLDALTGPVRMVRDDSGSDIEGNSINLTIGSCLDAPIPDDACGAQYCCPVNTFREGQCVVDPADPDTGCNLSAGAAVYEFDFSTRAENAQLDEICNDTITPACAGFPSCDGTLVCIPGAPCLCKLPCEGLGAFTPGVCAAPDDLLCAILGPDYVCDINTCYCVEQIAFDSCQGRAERTNMCEPSACPNSYGFCSPFDAPPEMPTGAACDDTCNSVVGCELGICDLVDDRCTLNAANNIDCSRTVTSITNTDILATCEYYDDPVNDANDGNRWHISAPGSCPNGSWRKLSTNQCVQMAVDGAYQPTCDICPGAMTCQNDFPAGVGSCVSDQQCQGDSYCVGTECMSGAEDTCQCCCRVGHDAEDCCYPLTCAGDCGANILDTGTDTYNLGRCTGCADAGATAAEHDAACNCEGNSDKFCDESVPGGVCVDCGELGPADCALEPACCLDAMHGDTCRGISPDGTKIVGGADDGYCSYYNCDNSDPVNIICDYTELTSGAYNNSITCDAECPYTGGLPGGSNCYDEGDPLIVGDESCGLVCASPYDCMGTANPPPADDCRCCCDTTDSNACTGADLVCLEAPPCENDNRGLCCGCEADTDCVDPAIDTGCGYDKCCRSRPYVSLVEPVDDATNVCQNAMIKATFNEKMNSASMVTNFHLVGEYVDACPAGTQYFVYNGNARPENRNTFVRWKNKTILSLAKVWNKIWGPESAIAYVAPQSIYNYCAVPGAVTTVQNALGQTEVSFQPSVFLDSERLYYGIIKGDMNLDSTNGVLNIWQIGLNASVNPGLSPSNGNNIFNGIDYANSYVWSFETMSDQEQNGGACLVHHIGLSPRSYLFKTTEDDVDEVDNDPNNALYDTEYDKDKVFTALAYSEDNQALSPVGEYSWDWNWSIDNNRIVDISSEPGYANTNNQQLLRATTTAIYGSTFARVEIDMAAANTITDGDGLMGASQVYVFICQNPWPPVINGQWNPWYDIDTNCNFATPGECANTNFSLYYCRDAGAPELMTICR
jgi:hypothetical protein